MSAPGPLYVGVDGGGTATRVLVADGEGRERARLQGPPSLVDPRAPEAAADVVAGVVRGALAGIGVAPPVAALHAGLAGAGSEPARAAVERALEREGLARSIQVGTDVEAAFHDVFGNGPGLLLLAGTGSMAWGRSESGRVVRVGGWGSLMGDEGSGWALGRACLRAVARAEDGRGPPTAMTPKVLDHLGVREPGDLVARVRGASKAEIAGLARIVAEAAREGDAVAGRMLAAAARALRSHLTALSGALAPWTEPPGVALAGGLLLPGGPLRAGVLDALEGSGMALAEVVPDAARGAAGLARDRAGGLGGAGGWAPGPE